MVVLLSNKCFFSCTSACVICSQKKITKVGPIFLLIYSPCNLSEVKGVAQDVIGSGFGLLC